MNEKERRRKMEVERRIAQGRLQPGELESCPECGQLLYPTRLNFHRSKIHSVEVPHGTAGRLSRGCKCEECRRYSRDGARRRRRQLALKDPVT